MSTYRVSNDDWQPDPEWPVKAIPQRWIEALFATMSAAYGARFADLWRGSNAIEVKRLWGVEMAKLTAAQMKAGRENLMQLVKPPTCPEFVAHCRQTHRESATYTVPQVENQPKADQQTIDSNLAGMRRISASFAQVREPTAQWAFRLLIRGKTASGGALTADVVKCAYDAICSTSGRRALAGCPDEDRTAFKELYDACIEGASGSGKQPWETP